MAQETSFGRWLAEVDDYIASRCGLHHADLPDVDYRGLYGAGDSPRDAAVFAIRNAADLDTDDLDDPLE